MPSLDYSINGDYSFKIQSSLDQYQGINFYLSLPEGSNKVKLEATFIKVQGNSLQIRINENDVNMDVYAPMNDNPQTISLEKTVTTNTCQIVFIFRHSNVITYIDNIKLITQ